MRAIIGWTRNSRKALVKIVARNQRRRPNGMAPGMDWSTVVSVVGPFLPSQRLTGGFARGGPVGGVDRISDGRIEIGPKAWVVIIQVGAADHAEPLH